MNINKLINEIKIKTGLLDQLRGAITDDEIYEVIMMTLDEFNRYSSFVMKYTLYDLFKTFQPNFINENVYSNVNRYEMDLPPFLLEMLTRNGCELKKILLLLAPQRRFMATSVDLKHDMHHISYNAMKGINSKIPKVFIRQPKTLIIEHMTGNMLFFQMYDIMVYVTHPKTLSTIDKGYEIWFEKLARKNLEIYLWNNRLRFINIDLGSVNVDLQVENFSNAESEKADLLSELKERAAADNLTMTTI